MQPALQGASWRHLLPPVPGMSPDPLGLSVLLCQIGVRTVPTPGVPGRIRVASAECLEQHPAGGECYRSVCERKPRREARQWG